MEIGVAVIGLGTVGRRYVEQFMAHADFAVIGGFDVDAAVAAKASADFGVEVFATAESLIGDERVGFVYIAVPPLWHEQYVDQVIAADKAMLCEKPLGVDETASAGMVERVTDWGGPAAVNFVFGGAPSAVELVRQVHAGAAGEIMGADLRLHFERWPRDWQSGATWLRDRDQGGWVREVVSHYVFLGLRLFGPVDVEHATVIWPDDGTSEQAIAATGRFGSTPLRIVGTSDCAGEDEVEFTVRGSQRSFRLTNWYGLTSAAPREPWAAVLSAEATGGPAAYAAQLGQMAALVRGEPQTLATFAEAFAVQSAVESLLVEAN